MVPLDLKESSSNQKPLSSSSSSLSGEGEEILKKLLDIDLSLAQKLRNMTPSEIGRMYGKNPGRQIFF